MNRFCFIILLFIAVHIQVFAQWTYFPSRYNDIPETKLKRAVHTILTVEQRGDSVLKTQVEVFDTNGRLTEIMIHQAGIDDDSREMTSLGIKTTFVYDASGKLTKKQRFLAEGQPIGYTIYFYDSKRRLVKEIDYSSNGTPTRKTTYSYLPKKREVEVRWNTTKSDEISGMPVKVSLFYNEKGQWVKRTALDSLNEDGTVYSGDFITFEYDEKGNFVSEVHCCKYKYSYHHSYKFDRQRNWIERKTTSIKVNSATGEEIVNPNWMQTYRIITYFPKNKRKR